MFETALQAIKSHTRIVLHRHTSPDGDAIGSQVGLAELIRENFPEKEVFLVGDDPARFAFLSGAVMDEIPDETYNGALAVILDCGASHLISDSRYGLAAQTLRFDHHLFCEKIADIDIVDSTFESCCGLLTAFAQACKFRLSLDAATALYCGMVTDSGRFRYDATTSRIFALASFLMTQPIDLNALSYNLYAEDFEAIRKRADNLLRIRFTERNVAYIYTTAEEVAASGESLFAISRGRIGLMNDIRGVFLWATLTEGEDGIQVELRSNRYNINPIAVKYGGGGHKKASGCKVPDKATAMQLLADLDALAETAPTE